MRIWFLIGFLVSFAASAEESTSTSCSRGDRLRIIEVVYPNAADLPCEVQYTKNGKTQTLWMAGNESGYCENKAAEFIARQRGWGWKCEPATASGENAAPGDTQ